MELNKTTVLKIFDKNFIFPIISTPLGYAIKMDPVSAFLFANITGAEYFDDPFIPFSPKGTTKIFEKAFEYKVVTGIFDNEKLYYAPYTLCENQTYLFSNDKYIVFKEFNDAHQMMLDLESDYDDLLKKGVIPSDYLIYRIETSKKGNGMEPFLEYLACEYFRKKGYIVDNQIPLVHSVGSPDFGGYKLHNKDNGFYILELALIRITKNIKILDDLSISHLIVGEAKTATNIMTRRLIKYLNTNIFKKGYELHPDKTKPGKDFFGLLSLNNDYSIVCLEPNTQYEFHQSIGLNFDDYLEWYTDSLKMYILSNLTNDELYSYIQSKSSKGKYSIKKIINVIRELPLQTVINDIKEIIF